MSSTTTERTINEFRLIFASQFAEFMRKNGIKQTLVPS